MQVTVVVAESRRMVREGVTALIGTSNSFVVSAGAEDGYQAIELAEALRPRLMVVNPQLRRMSGVDVVMQVSSLDFGPAVLGLGDSEDPARAREFLDAGAQGYLAFGATKEDLFDALRTIARGGIFVDPRFAEQVILGGSEPRPSGAASPVASAAANLEPWRMAVRDAVVRSAPRRRILTNRERTVWQQVAEGSSTKEIASLLGVSTKTVLSHRSELMRKLGARSVADLTRAAIERGLISVPS